MAARQPEIPKTVAIKVRSQPQARDSAAASCGPFVCDPHHIAARGRVPKFRPDFLRGSPTTKTAPTSIFPFIRSARLRTDAGLNGVRKPGPLQYSRRARLSIE